MCSSGVSVLAHEVAHCVVARRFRIPIERISLSFLAGHSALAREPETPGRRRRRSPGRPAHQPPDRRGRIRRVTQFPDGSIALVLAAGLAWSNVVVGVYNLLPGLPLDGGQLLRAAIWRVTGSPRTARSVPPGPVA